MTARLATPSMLGMLVLLTGGAAGCVPPAWDATEKPASAPEAARPAAAAPDPDPVATIPAGWDQLPPAPAADAPLVAYPSTEALAAALARVPITNHTWYPYQPTIASGGLAPTSSGSSGPSGPSSTSSGTTVQEAGVDEADLVKHDGRYAFVCTGSKVRVVDTRPLASLREVASLVVEGVATGCYLADGRLVVLSTFTQLTSGTTWQSGVAVTVFDVTDPTEPVAAGARYFDGGLHASRLIVDRLFLVLNHKAALTTDMTDAERVAAFLPTVRMSLADAGADLLGATAVYHERDEAVPHNSLVAVAMLDVTDPTGAVAAVATALPPGGPTYVALGSLYTSNTDCSDGTLRTMFHKFRLTSHGAGYVGSGAVDGTLLNPYSCGEWRDHLRVATTEWSTSNTTWMGLTTSTTVTVLGEQNGRLVTTGRISDIEPGEALNTARFLGDRGYLITSVQAIDPLFTLDLSDPANPRLVGEFEYAGVADFLFPVSRDRLLAVGRRAEWGTLAGVELSLFDVSNLAAPRRITSLTVATGSAWTEVRFDPHAFAWHGARRQFAFPLTETVAGTWWQRVSLQVCELAGDTIQLRGALSLGDETWYWGGLRGLFLDGDVLGVAPDRMVGNAVDALGSGQVTMLFQ